MLQQQGFAQASKLADFYGNIMDQPIATTRQRPEAEPAFERGFQRLAPRGYVPGDFGVLQNPPQYFGMRLVAPQTGGSYGLLPNVQGAELPPSAGRIMTQGPIAPFDKNDPHQNDLPLVPPNMPPDRNAMQQMLYGELIRRGYPVRSGSGEFFGLPVQSVIGFGSRE